jgi:hypothetical protein
MLSEHSGEKTETVFERIQLHLESWKDVKIEQISTKRLPGLSNACYREDAPVNDQPVVLYRKFEC